MKKTDKIWFDMGPKPIKVGFTSKPEIFARAVESMGLGPAVFMESGKSGRCSFFRRDGYWATCIVTIDAKHMSGRSIGHIAGIMTHEATHVWQEYCDAAGEDRPGAEDMAYFIQYLTHAFLRAFLRENPKIKVRRS